MGHIRLGRLPRTRRWQEVVALLSKDAPLEQIAGATARAAESALGAAHKDPAVGYSYWLLSQIPIAARSTDFTSSLENLGLRAGQQPTLMSIVGAFSDAVDRHVARTGNKTDLGEIAQLVAAESLISVAGQYLPSLFGPTPADVKHAFGRLAAPDRFAGLAREFFARLTRRYLDYFLSREISNHVGPGKKLKSIDDHTAFNRALEQHCREGSRIVEAFAGGWYSKARFEGTLTPETARNFVFIALRKTQSELRKRAQPNA